MYHTPFVTSQITLLLNAGVLLDLLKFQFTRAPTPTANMRGNADNVKVTSDTRALHIRVLIYGRGSHAARRSNPFTNPPTYDFTSI